MNNLDHSFSNASACARSFYNVGGQSEEFASEFFNLDRKSLTEENNEPITSDAEPQKFIDSSSFSVQVRKRLTSLLLSSTALRAFSSLHIELHKILAKDEISKFPFLAVAIGMSSKGVINCVRGVYEKNLGKAYWGAVQYMIAVLSWGCVSNLSPRLTNVIHESSLLAFSSAYVAAAGIKDLSKRSFLKGCCKFLLGSGGLAFSGYHFYNNLFPPQHQMDLKVQLFIDKHLNDIGIISEKKRCVDDWELLGSGIAKRVYVHPDLTDYVLKIDNDFYPSEYSPTRIHFENTKYARDVVEVRNYDKLQIPLSYLLETNSGAVVFEQRIFPDNTKYNEDAIWQLKHFLWTTNIIDVSIDDYHNAYWTSDAKIALFDFDLKFQNIFSLMRQMQMFNDDKFPANALNLQHNLTFQSLNSNNCPRPNNLTIF